MFALIFANRKTLLVLGGLTIFQLLCTSSVIGYGIQHQESLRQLQATQWCLFYLLAGVLIAFSALPNTFLALVGGYFLGFMALPFMSFAYGVALVIGYLIARILDGGSFWQSLSAHPRIQQTILQLQTHDFWLVLFARLSPLLPFVVMNQVLYALQVSKKQFFVGSLLGMLPRMLLLTWIGTTSSQINWQAWQDTPLTYWGQLFFLVLSSLGLGVVLKKGLHPHK